MNAKKIALLRAARERIADGRENYICHAIDASEKNGTLSAARYLRRWIDSMLGRQYFSYGSWLLAHHPEIYVAALRRSDGNKDLAAGRLQWIDWMISELEREA